MKNKNNYEYLLQDLSKLKGVGKKTTEILKKRKLIIYLIYYGDYLNHIQIGQKLVKLMNFKLEKFIP